MPSDTYTLTISDAGVSTPATDSVTNASVAAGAAIAFSKLATLTSGNILVGSSANVPTSVALTGDVTVSNTGVAAIASGAIVNADVNASAAIAHSKLAPMSSGNILVGSSGSVPTSVAVTGDITVSSSGVTAVTSDAVTFAKMQNVSGYTILGKPTTGSGDVAEIGSSSFMLESGTGFLRQTDASTARSTLGLGALATLSSVTATTGGTGQTIYTVGDILYASTTTALSKLASGAANTVLRSNGTIPSYGQVVLTTDVTGTLPVANGGTGYASYAIGDILYASSSTALSKLADVATGNALLSGGVGTAPAYGKVGLTTHVDGTLPVANGGTGAVTLTGYVKGTGTTAMTASATVPVADVSGLGTGVATFLATPSSANLAAAVTGETGSGALVFATSPTLVTPVIGVATGTSLAATGAITSSGTAGIGYATGSGGTVTQLTSKSTTVTLNKTCGQITMDAASLAHDTVVSFTLTNSTIAAGDVLILNHLNGGSVGRYMLNAQCVGGSATINVKNTNPTSGALAEAIVIAFVVIKAVTA